MRVLLVLLSSVCSLAQAVVVMNDDFSSYSGVIGGDDWHQTWKTNQNSLVTGNGQYASIATTNTLSNYLIQGTTGFSLTGTETATIDYRVRYTHDSGGQTSTKNKAFISSLIKTGDKWWSGDSETQALVNRGSAIGLAHDATTPGLFVEGWLTGGTYFGVNHNNGGESDWFRVSSTIAVTNGVYTMDTKILDDSSNVLFDGSTQNSTIAEGSTIYAGFTTAYNGSNTATTYEQTKILGVDVDDFVVETSVVIPEPATIGMIGVLGGAGIFIRRRFMI